MIPVINHYLFITQLRQHSKIQKKTYEHICLSDLKTQICPSLMWYSLSDATADDADWQISSVTSSPPTHRELRHVIVQLMTSWSRDKVSLQRRTTLSSAMYVNQAPGGSTGLRQPNAGHTPSILTSVTQHIQPDFFVLEKYFSFATAVLVNKGFRSNHSEAKRSGY